MTQIRSNDLHRRAVAAVDGGMSRRERRGASGSRLLRRLVLAGEGAIDQRDRLREPVKRDERAHAWALALAQEDLVERTEPVPE